MRSTETLLAATMRQMTRAAMAVVAEVAARMSSGRPVSSLK
jgi:hypothetical protein